MLGSFMEEMQISPEQFAGVLPARAHLECSASDVHRAKVLR